MDQTNSANVDCKNPRCKKQYSINTIQRHLSRNPECKNTYTLEGLAELEKMCVAHRKKRLKDNYERKKNQAKMTLHVSESQY